jgi:hypothetical protein
LLDARAATTDTGPIDVTITGDGRFLYVLNGAGSSIGGYKIKFDGRLIPVPGGATGLPLSANGIAVR